MQTQGEIDLIHVTGGDIRVDTGDGGVERQCIDTGLQRSDTGHSRASLLRQPCADLCCRQQRAGVEQQYFRQRQVDGPLGRVQRGRAQFVSEQPDRMRMRLHCRQQSRQLVGAGALQPAAIAGVQTRAWLRGGGVGIVEQRKTGLHGRFDDGRQHHGFLFT